MKTLKILFTVLLTSVFIASCSSSDDDSTKVKYQIVGLDSSVTQIKYKKANGSIETLTDFEDFAGSGDSRTINVKDFPFTADLEVTVNNTSGNVKTYSLAIYVDNEVVDFTPLQVPANATSTADVDFLIATDNTDN